jgi:2-polyprenyl-3-methyl-5-hydroxy-6-metoxy-1,4-benzoquinol methylase
MHKEPKDILLELRAIKESKIEIFHDRTRDRLDVKVYKCTESGVIFLSTSKHMTIHHYEQKTNFVYGKDDSRKESIIASLEDTQRRETFLKPLIANKKWIDIGTGQGAILERLSKYAKDSAGVEPQAFANNELKSLGYKMYNNVEELENTDYDVVSLFHVLEHVIDPIDLLKKINSKMKVGAKIVIEVPHANDILISLLNLESFKDFTFWSEHLILHTRESLNLLLKYCGFTSIYVQGVQRYPLSNHLHWLSKNKPGGHNIWNFLNSSNIISSYETTLSGLNLTDTLLLTAIKS